MKIITTLGVGAAMLAGSAITSQAQELHFIMCGNDPMDADLAVIADFEAANAGVTVNLEQVPWGTCQDKAMTLAAAGDPPSIAYMGSRTLRQLASNDLIVPVNIADENRDSYQPGILNTVTIEGVEWGYPRAFSTKALYINCGLVEAAGMQCTAPHTWDGMFNMAKAVNDNTDAAGVGLAGKDFDNTMHQFLNYLYSNGGVVIDPATGENKLDSEATRETLAFYERLVSVAQEGPTAWERSQLKDLYNDGKIGMYIDGPWGAGQHKDNIKEIVVPVPAGPNGNNGTLLITDSIAVFKGSGHEDLAQQLATMLTTGDSQYTLDQSWGLTPIFDYAKLGFENPYYEGDPVWEVFVNGIAGGGPEPLVEEFKGLQSAFTNMIQGVILGDDTVDNLVTIAGEELSEAM